VHRSLASPERGATGTRARDEDSTVDLKSLGWNPQLQTTWNEIGDPSAAPARVVAVHRGAFAVAGHPSVARSELVGRLARDPDPLARPAVGDWVAIDAGGRIDRVLPRHSQLVRRAAGAAHEAQVVAANIDRVLLVTSLNSDLNPRRIERTLALAWDSGAAPALVLTKSDLGDPAAALGELDDLVMGAPVLITSAVDGRGIDALRALVAPGTAVLVGSSGVGKSSLINALLGEERQQVLPIRDGDERGRHATTHRELFPLPGGGLLIDTPGMREIGIWDDDGGIDAAFADIDAVAARCRFRSCAHGEEPDCAVLAEIAPERLAAWRKLQRELAHAERRLDRRVARDSKSRWKAIHKQARARRRVDPKLEG
jgi:ribosome biogenesis GTPase